ncbi:hypothetical protein FRC07_011809, partial [Ceratobasidium sp. 392]
MRVALTFFIAATAALALSRFDGQANKGINPDRGSIPGVGSDSLPPVPVKPSTNAKRFVPSLPPLAPGAHRRHPPLNQTCNILVKTVNDTLGYLAPVYNDFGEYGVLQPDQIGALEVAFTYSPDSPRQIDILATNNPMNEFPFLGGVVGFASNNSDFGPGDYDYAYIAGTGQTPPGSPPVLQDSSFAVIFGIPSDVESAIWVYEPKSRDLSIQWVNSDRSMPATQLVYANDFNQALLITGDSQALREHFGATYPDVTLTCIK